jgi:thiol-disulfide isomerase/thioredoxin
MKRIISLLLIVITMFVLVGCSKKTEFNEINAEEVFTTEGKYFVYFYKDDCDDCEQTKPVIIDYMKKIEDDKELADKRKVYAVNLSKPENASIYRAYNSVKYGWGEGQGDGSFWVNGVSKLDNLFIGATSALISVGSDANGNRVANFQASGFDNISSTLTTYLS